MKIDSSAIGMESARNYQSEKTTTRRFRITEYQAALGNNNALYADINNGSANVAKDGSDGEDADNDSANVSGLTAAEWQNRLGVSVSKVSIRTPEENSLSKLRQMTLRYIFELLFSPRRSRNVTEDGSLGAINSGQTTYTEEDRVSLLWQDRENVFSFRGQNSGAGILSQSLNFIEARPVKDIRIVNENHEKETEETKFSTVGTVRTSDGREIRFDVNVGMSRSFERYYMEEMSAKEVAMCDPLVINLDTDVADLGDQTFFFDIDADGEKDEIARLGAGSGYLALDKNGDGAINDGSELFGTASGNGFEDLAQYDEDGNGWIDENDAIWQKLKIWTKDERGRDVLYRLADKGVGAICLKNVATDFTIKVEDGRTKGAIRNSGVFLYENGNVGTIQHVDVAKYAKLA